MQISIKKYDPKQATDCLILPVYSDKQQALITTEFNKHNNNIIDELITHKDLTGKSGEFKWLYNIAPNVKRVLCVGLGETKKLTASSFISLLTQTMEKLTTRAYDSVINGLADVSFPKDYSSTELMPRDWVINQALIITENFRQVIKTYQKSPIPALDIANYTLCHTATDYSNSKDEHSKSIDTSHAISKAIRLTKNLTNTPPNICNPEYLEQEALNIVKDYSKLSCYAYHHDKLKDMGLGAFYAVSRGSYNSGRMIILQYNNNPDQDRPYVLVGKGITYDTGGYSLKPSASMVGMKYDMTGAASVLATMQAIADLDLPINVVGVMACAENMISGNSTRPDDIVTSLSGITIEINNTDAEGRLVLCDAITYSEKFKPKVIIDIATLTGAAVVALGYHYTALYTNNNNLMQDLVSASHAGFDPVWPMPLCQDYDGLMKSNIADLKNSSALPVAGSVTAACFLANFIPEDTAWAHLDIAGSATVKAEHRESTGRPVQLLVNYFIEQAKA